MLSVFEVGEKIAVARKFKNLSQAQLSELLAVSAQAVGKWERGESMPDIITFQRLAEVLDVDLNYFAGFGNAAAVSISPAVAPAEVATVHKPGWNMSSANWADADFSGLSGLAERFRAANIENCRFIGSELSGLTLKANNITGCDFTRSDLKASRFSGSNLHNSTFCESNLSRSEFIRSNIRDSDFSRALLTDTLFKWSHLQKLNISGAVMSGAAFQYGQLSDITFSGEVKDCSFENCDFARVEFHGAIILNTFFKNCKLKRARFTSCKADKLSYAFMKSSKADLSGVEILQTV